MGKSATHFTMDIEFTGQVLMAADHQLLEISIVEK